MQLFVTFAILIGLLIKENKCATTDHVLSISPRQEKEVELLQNVTRLYETILWQPASPNQIKVDTEVHMFVPASRQTAIKEYLDSHQFVYRVLVENTQELINQQTKYDFKDPRTMSSYYERYHSLEEIYHWVNKTTQEYPKMVKVIMIGSSFEKHPLLVLKLSGKGAQPKRAMWIDCGIHAREWIAPAFCLWFVQYSITFYNQNTEITEILDNLDVYVLPVMNPDGYKYSWTDNRMWRKNRSRHPHSTCIGTDLNRNFDANWCTTGSSNDPCDETYCGRFPESEPESEAVSNFLRSKTNIMKLYLSIHSYSQMLIFPYSCTYQEARNFKELHDLAQEATMKIKMYYKNNYKFGPGATSFYLAPGGSDDWAYNLGIDYSFTFELQDNGRYGFLLPPSYISKACNEALIAVKSIAVNVIKKTQRF